jgi:hypothetical protein
MCRCEGSDFVEPAGRLPELLAITAAYELRFHAITAPRVTRTDGYAFAIPSLGVPQMNADEMNWLRI